MKPIFLILGFFLVTAAAHATNKVSSPNVYKDRLELEYRLGYDMDDADTRDKAHQHKVVANYGLTDRLRAEGKLVYDDAPRDSGDISGMELSARWQFFKTDEAWAAMAAEINYQPSFIAEDSDALEYKMLARKKLGKLVHTAYVSLLDPMGEDSDSGARITAAMKSRYRLDAYFQPGIEAYTDLLALNNESRRHYVGPFLEGRINDKIKYEMGYLFGLSSAAVDGRAKFIIAYEWQF